MRRMYGAADVDSTKGAAGAVGVLEIACIVMHQWCDGEHNSCCTYMQNTHVYRPLL